MNAFAIGLLTAYYVCLAGLAVYGVHRLALVVMVRRRRRGAPPAGPVADLPHVTVQLPVYNELYVLDRLVGAACSLRWPRERLQIQILDDSTDGTSAMALDLAASWRARGVAIDCLHRGSRDGFKAGALAAGLAAARGDLIAVFDADFVPPADFLERATPWFADPRVGMVQARWGHLNRGWSALTRAQALLLDGHFAVEQPARAATGRFFNFNGTAGIFRRACIESAGGWQADTLTEDLDLSYRAQLEGWRFVFLEDPACPAELPVEMNALRSQQHRWAKGSVQTARKLVPRILRAPIPLAVKAEALLHLTNNVAYLLLLLVALLLVPSLHARIEAGWRTALPDLAVLLAGTGSFALFCLASQRRGIRGLARAARDLPLVMMLGAGLSLNNGLAVLEALAGRRSEFRRTPKLRIADGGGTRPWQSLAYRGDPARLVGAEAALALFFAGSIVWAFDEALYASIPFLALFAAGFASVSGLTLAQGFSIRAWRRRILEEAEGRGPA